MQRSAVFGSCAQSVGTVASVLFAVINRTGHYDETARDSVTTRKAKILYVSLLESVQKERGEWQGFSSSSADPNNNNGPEDTEVQSPHDLLTTSIAMSSTADQLGVLNELLEVSFRNLMGPLVPLELYTRHKKLLLRESLAVPPALTALLAIRGVLDRLEREVRHCLLRLLALWDLIAIVSGETQPLLKTIADKHHHVFSESSEFESMLQINSRLIEDIRLKAWPAELEPALLSDEEDDRFSSDGDISSSISDENQELHDDDDAGMPWGKNSISDPGLTLRPRASSSVPSVLEDEEQQDGGHYYNYEDGEDDEKGWSIPSPSRYSYHHRSQDRNTQRSHSIASPPVSGGAGPLVPVPMVPSSSEGIPAPHITDTLTLVPRPIERIPSGRRHSQRPLSTPPDSPTHSAISQTSSGTRSSSRKLKLRTKQRSVTSLNGSSRRDDHQRHDNHWHDTASSESRSPPPPPRSTTRRSSSKRLRSSRNSSARRRRASAQSADQSVQDDVRQPTEIRAKATADPSFLSRAASYLTIPVAAATLCVIATMTTLAIYEMRKAQRN
ncbi:unnamed protein product [Phytophthora lilii]|uniref:Unnamed protein product n=1 Tax=Phytophthora lilii TaxID=2077276 RepID=A0A9W6TZ02_9STRA|nr:unnamed protein product [Phytophthora lilii]